MRNVALLLCVFAAAGGVIKLPPNLKRCRQNDPRLNDCLKDAVQDALKKLKNGAQKLGVFPLDPLEITTLDLGHGNGPVNIGLRFDNIKVHGISESKIVNQWSRLNEYYLDADAYTPSLQIESDYMMDGKVLLLPIHGKGKCSITLKDLKSKLTQKGEPIKKNGRIYMNETEFLYKMAPNNMILHFDNLFNGEPALGARMNTFLNENWREVLKELQPGLEEALGEIFKNIANRFFLKVPYNEIFPEE